MKWMEMLTCLLTQFKKICDSIIKGCVKQKQKLVKISCFTFLL